MPEPLDDQTVSAPEVSCPHCGASVVCDKTSPWRPFCSERCRLIDLGAWFAEEHAIPDGAGKDPGEEL